MRGQSMAEDGTSRAPARPLITFILLAYKQERFIRESVAGALAQTYRPLEIILSDDGSPDRTYEIMCEMAAAYQGPHKVVLNRNEPNLGVARHFNRLVERAAGEYIVCAAGDDIALPERTEKSWEILSRTPNVMCVSLALQIIDINGRFLGSGAQSATGAQVKNYTVEDYLSTPGFHLVGASRAFRKSVYTTFGPLRPTCATEDSTMLLRCLMLGTACFSHDVGVHYRVHGTNLSAEGNRHSFKHERVFRQWVRDIRRAHHLGRVSDCLAKRLKRRAVRSLRRRRIEAALNGSQPPSLLLWPRILFCRGFTVREEIRMFRAALRQRLQNLIPRFGSRRSLIQQTRQ